MRKLLAGTVIAAAVAGAAALPASAQGGSAPRPAPTGTLTVVHGIPGKDGFPVTVDIRNLTTRTTVATDVPAVFGDNPVVPGLPVGRYQVDVKVGGKVVLSERTNLKAGDVDAVVAHLTADGKPTISDYNTPTRKVQGTRVVVRHAAAAPAVDVWATPGDCTAPKGVNDIKIISNLANPDQARVDVPAGSYCVRVKAAGTFTTVLEAPFTLAPNTVYAVHAVGSLAGGTFAPVVQAFPGR